MDCVELSLPWAYRKLLCFRLLNQLRLNGVILVLAWRHLILFHIAMLKPQAGGPAGKSVAAALQQSDRKNTNSLQSLEHLLH